MAVFASDECKISDISSALTHSERNMAVINTRIFPDSVSFLCPSISKPNSNSGKAISKYLKCIQTF